MMYDIIIIATNKDFHKIKYVYDSVITNIQGYNKIYCFCPEYPIDRMDGITYVLDEGVMNIDMSVVKFKPQWIYQQYLKLLQEVTLELYLVIDSDIIINKPLDIFENNKPNFLLSNSVNYKTFFNYSRLLFDIDKEYEGSFISEIMFFDRNLIKEMVSTKFKSNNEFISESNKIITNTCFLSEYELYGNYVYKFHEDSYNYKIIKMLRTFPKISISEEEILQYIEENKNSPYDILSISTLS